MKKSLSALMHINESCCICAILPHL